MKRAGILLLVVCSLPLAAQVDRLDRERMRDILNVVAKDVEKNFYDPQLHGLNWKELTEQARQKIDNAKSAGEMITAIFVLVDKLQDSHTKFLPPSRVNRPLFGFEAKAFGDDIRIYQLKKNGAAAEAGLHLGDRILRVNGFTAERNSFDLMLLYFRYLRPVPEMNITYARGSDPPQTTQVKAKIKRGTMVLDLTNDLNIWDLLEEYADDSRRDHEVMLEGDIGYLEITDFDTQEVGIVHQLSASKAVIVDLRGNPGGYRNAVLELAGHFEAGPAIMAEEIGRKKTEQLKIKPQKPNFPVPLFILVDSRSASAAEMFARHFQRTGRAVVIGDHSSGRVNSSMFFSERIGTDRIVPFGVQISVGKLVFPGGEELEKQGVTPDVVCLPASDDLHEHRDPCLKQAVSLARKKLGLSEELPPKVRAEVEGLTATIAREKQERLDQQRD